MKITAQTRILHNGMTPRILAAVEDMNSLFAKILGTPLQITQHTGAMPKNAIFIGWHSFFNQEAPNEPEQVLITVRNNRAMICGRDMPAIVDTIKDHNGKILTGVQSEYGTINAIVTFLTDFLGFRFFYPGEDGTYYPDTLQSANKSVRYTPSIRDRSIFHLLRFEVNAKSRSLENQWARRNRVQMDSLRLNPNHHFKDYWAKYGESHPQIFALTRGERKPIKGMTTKIKMCYTDPSLWALWMDNVANQLQANPNQTYFSAAANDGWTTGHCTCNKCMALGGYEEQGKKEVWFANKLGELLEEKYPGKDYKVLIQAYGFSRQAPTDIKPRHNVHICHVGNFIQRGEGVQDERSNMMQWYSDWAALTDNISLRPNLGNPVGCKIGFPDFDLKQLCEDFKFLHEKGCKGLWFDAIWNHWLTQFPYYYTLSRLAYNPTLNYDSLMKDFYKKCYGEAAGEMRKFWELIQSTRRQMMAEIPHRFRFDTDFKQAILMFRYLVESKQ